jgi:micrococcal nuclease
MDAFFALVFFGSLICFFVGIVWPNSFKHIPYLKKRLSRRYLAGFFFSLMVVSLFMFSLFVEDVDHYEEVRDEEVLLDVSQEETVVADDYRLEVVSDDSGEDHIANTRSEILYKVDRVVDGDTVDVVIDGRVERVRLIGINTPETVHPSKPVECFGVEASNKAKNTLSGEKVFLEFDDTQGRLDKYGRFLAYVFLEDGTNFNLSMINDGYAYEYTYDLSYKYQSEFKAAEAFARENSKGLWGSVCEDETKSVPAVSPNNSQSGNDNGCNIKGNISLSNEEKIYHIPGCDYYSQTRITESKGERWFCSEEEAINAGWRKAMNCL